MLGQAVQANRDAVPEEFLKEMEGMAAGCHDRGYEVTVEDLLMLNCGYDMLESLIMNLA